MTGPDSQRLRYQILGQLEVSRARLPVEVGGDKAKRLLATLLLQPGHTVSTDVLVDVLWPSTPPRSAVANLRTYVSSLRGRLGITGDGPLQTRPSGYRIDLDEDDSDLLRFERLVGEARKRHASNETAQAAALLDEANQLWRGDPLADLSTAPEWEITLSRLKALRLEAEELRLGTLVSLGRPAQAVPDLRTLVGEHPLREQLWFELVRALHGAGRRAEALQAYADARAVLVDELGIDPGPALRGLQLTILADADANTSVPAVPSLQVFQTPPDICDFVGRTTETSEAQAALAKGFVLLTGPVGVGKSALAVHVAHQLRERFPDGQIYVDCHAADDRTPAGLLAETLAALSVTHVAPGLAGRTAQFRSLMADRAVLVLVDNADTADQVAAFLPATAGSAALATSRHHLPALPGFRRIPVPPLENPDAHKLLTALVGATRTDAEPTAAQEIITACDGLPLAIRSVAAGMIAQPYRPLWSAAAPPVAPEDGIALATERVRVSLDADFRGLPPGAADALTALATLAPEPVPDWLVSALSPTDAGFDEVVAAGLLQPVGTDALGVPTYRLSALVRRYLDGREPLPFPALEKMASGWLSLLAYASEALPVGFFRLEPEQAARRAQIAPAAPIVACARRNAVRWLESEQSRLVTVTEQAAAAGAAGLAVDLAVGLVSFFELRANVDDWRRTHRAALQAAVAAGDKRGEATILRGLGQLDLYADAYTSATGKFHRSLTLFTELEDSRGAAAALSGLGAAHHYDKNDRLALDFYRLALKLYEKSGNAHGVAYARAAIGLVAISAGDAVNARRWLDRARQDALDINDHNRSAQVLHKLGMLMHSQGESAMASAYQREAMTIFASLGNDLGVANTKLHLGRLSAEGGASAPAIALLEETLPTYRTLGDRRSEVDALLLLSDLNESERRAGPAWRYRQRAAHLTQTLRTGA